MPKFFEPANPPKIESRVKSQESTLDDPVTEKRANQQTSSESTTSEEHQYFSPKISESGEVKTLLEWTAPSRPFRPKDRSYYTTIAILVILLCLIALMAQEILLIGVLLALAFVAYVLAYVPPTDIKYKISTQGITIGDHFYFWHDCESFWFKEKEGHQVLFIQTYFMFPAQLMLVLKDIDQEEIKKTVARFLPFHEIPRTSFIDRWGEKLQKHFPLENTHH